MAPFVILGLFISLATLRLPRQSTMGLFNSLIRRAPVSDFAKTLAQDIAKRYPPALEQHPDKRPSVNRLTRILEDVCNKTSDFQAEHKLGWIGKAKLGNDFRWELRDLGYRKDFVDFATEAVVVHLNKKRKS